MGTPTDTETKDEESAAILKEKGNAAFKNEEWESAIGFYSKAVKVSPDEKDSAVYLKNRAAAYLKMEKYEQAVDDCTKSLELVKGDPKALFRRAQALENLERYEEAYRDATEVLKADPSNKIIQPVLERLHRIVQERAAQNAQVTNKVDSMTKYAFDPAIDREKRETAINNLLVLSRQKIGAEVILKTGVLQKIQSIIKVEKNKQVTLSAIRLIGEICKNSIENAKMVLKQVGLPWFLEVMDSSDQEQVNASEHCMQTILNTFSGMDNKPDTKPDKELCEKYNFQIDTLLKSLVFRLKNPAITGITRDAIIELLIKNIHFNTLNWALRLVEIEGVQRLMECASEVEDIKYESSMNITSQTQTIASVCLARVYENMYYDAAKKKFMDEIDKFVVTKLRSPDIESKIRLTVALTGLLRGPLEVGNSIIAREGIIEMILVMANSEEVIQQRVACECIIAAASKADKAKAIMGQGVHILKKLYASHSNPGIRVRALVGLCKLASAGGLDASIKPFAEGSLLKLAEACRRFLLNPGKDKDLRKWSAEGLSYLTLDAEVKEKLVEDQAALQALIDLGKTGDQSVLYGIVTTLVNLCNAYEKQEVLPEMVELAKFAKQHIPQDHELDDPDFVSKRILVLGKANVASALVPLAKTESNNSRELISRVFNALCSEPSLRGSVVQQGGVKVLISLAHNGTEKGKRQAAQALARIGVTTNPEIAFSGQRSLEVVRPLLLLLHQEYNALENFEALMALCNIAQLNEAARQRILKEGGLSKIDHYLYEDHEMLRRAATQAVTNLTMSPDVVKIYEGENDRLKYLVILCSEDDLETSLAASGALAILTNCSEICCSKVFEASSWLETLQFLLANTNANVQYRGATIVKNMMQSSKEVAQKLIETNVMEILMALTKSEEERLKEVKGVAEEALKGAETWGVIKAHDGSGTTRSLDPLAEQATEDAPEE